MNWRYIKLKSNGNFSTLEKQNIFPINGVSIKWYFNETKNKLYFYFFYNNELINWRYDILKPLSNDFRKWEAKGTVLCSSFNFYLTMI